MLLGCETKKKPTATIDQNAKEKWPSDFSKIVGQRITLEGKALNAKLGALLRHDEEIIWIENLASWPEGFYQGNDRGKLLRVTGIVIRKDDLPVFLAKPGETFLSGIPVDSEEELESKKWRFLLKDATWVLLD
jgi:hypothetical protein